MRRLLVVLGVLLLVLGGGCALDEPRAAGVTERWLTAVGDQGKKNLVTKSQELAAEVIPPNAAEDERHFSDLEVGKAIESGDTARVPFRLTARIEGNDTEERSGTAVLGRRDNQWYVEDVVARGPGEEVPSEGGARPATATGGHWVATIVLGVLVTAISALVIARQPQSTIGRASE
jgi:hypothetical protein